MAVLQNNPTRQLVGIKPIQPIRLLIMIRLSPSQMYAIRFQIGLASISLMHFGNITGLEVVGSIDALLAVVVLLHLDHPTVVGPIEKLFLEQNRLSVLGDLGEKRPFGSFRRFE